MTVAELIKELSIYPQDAPILTWHYDESNDDPKVYMDERKVYIA